jgi:hypothetical protein
MNGVNLKQPEIVTWLWINTYYSTIFNGMNIHFNPAILMRTSGVQGFDTLRYEHIPGNVIPIYISPGEDYVF